MLSAVRFKLLGPLEVWDGDRLVSLGGPQQRALLAALLLNANQAVSVDRLIACLWGDRPPATARALLHGCVRQLRRALRHDGRAGQPLVTRSPGYLIEVHPGELDLQRFDELDQEAARLLEAAEPGAVERAARLLREALALWRGPVLGDLDADAFQAEAARLEERRLVALERRIDLDLRLRRFGGLVAELRALVGEQPLRERLWAQLMIALDGADRRADALAAFRQLRRGLVEQLGVEPGAMLQELERAILAGDDPLAVYQRQPGGPDPAPDLAPDQGRRRPPDPAAGAAARAPVPAQLPAAIASFVGRAEHLRRLDALLEPDGAGAVAVAAIAGTAGVGKTALAIHWAHRVADRFPDGQLHVNLRGFAPGPPLRPIEALAGFLLVLGVDRGSVPVAVEQAAGMFRSLLAGRRVLVVLDNARSAEQVRPLLPGGPGCVVLVTSRDRLAGLVARDGARRLALDVLGEDEALALFASVLGEERLRREPGAAADLARLCAYLPLALRIAAANLIDEPERAIGDYVAELARGTRLANLQVDGDPDAALRATFDLSYAALDVEARRLFRLLGLVPGPDVTAEAAAALAGSAPGHAGRLLARLADAHLLHRLPEARYTFHDLLCLYAGERTRREDGAGERARARRRLLDWYLDTAHAAAGLLYPGMVRLPPPPAGRPPPTAPLGFDSHAAALAWLDAEWPNLLAAARDAAGDGPRELAWGLADALRGYCWTRTHAVDWLAVAEGGAAAAEAEGDLYARAAAQLALGDANQRLQRYPVAIECYSRAVGLNQESGWLQGLAASLTNLGLVYRELGRLSDAADHLAKALRADRQGGWLAGQASRLSNLGEVLRDLGRLREAVSHQLQALAVDRRIGSRGGEAIDLTNLGATRLELGQLDQALDHLTQALAAHREAGNRRAETECLRLIAEVHREAGRHAEALDVARVAAALARDVDDPVFEANTRNTVGAAGAALGHHAEAADQFERALALSRAVHSRAGELAALVGLAAARDHLGDRDQATVLAGHAVALAGRAGYRVIEGQALTTLAHIAGHGAEAAKHARRALTIHRETGHRPGQARTLALLADMLDAAGDPAAGAHRREAAALLADMGADADADAAGVPEVGAGGGTFRAGLREVNPRAPVARPRGDGDQPWSRPPSHGPD